MIFIHSTGSQKSNKVDFFPTNSLEFNHRRRIVETEIFLSAGFIELQGLKGGEIVQFIRRSSSVYLHFRTKLKHDNIVDMVMMRFF